MKRLAFAALALTLTSCTALLAPPKLECKVCWVPAPCPENWIGLTSGGCMLVVPPEYECPTLDDQEEP